MPLTEEQQLQLNFHEALDSSRRAHELAMESRRARLESVRLAKETLVENSRSKPVDSRDVSADDITTFAAKLEAYVNG